jgi:predicted HTH transcriptional regulator
MKPVSEWDEAYLLELISVGEQESLTLDYKRSAALAKDDPKKNDLSKAVSAFANSEGGVLVYGMKEDKHVPTDIDEGIDRNVITKEWLESAHPDRPAHRGDPRSDGTGEVEHRENAGITVTAIPSRARAPAPQNSTARTASHPIHFEMDATGRLVIPPQRTTNG